MQEFSIGAGLAALAFWGFIATIIVAGIWLDIRKREAQHETMRRLVESGQPINQELMDKLLSLTDSSSEDHELNFRVTALWVLPVSLGLAVLGLVLGTQVPQAQTPILAAAALTACMGIGFWVASTIVRNKYPHDNNSKHN